MFNLSSFKTINSQSHFSTDWVTVFGVHLRSLSEKTIQVLLNGSRISRLKKEILISFVEELKTTISPKMDNECNVLIFNINWPCAESEEFQDWDAIVSFVRNKKNFQEWIWVVSVQSYSKDILENPWITSRSKKKLMNIKDDFRRKLLGN